MSATPARRIKYVRTNDGVRFGVETDDRYASGIGGPGELVRADQELGDVVARIARTIREGVTKDSRRAFQEGSQSAEVESVVVEFGLEMDEEGAISVVRGRETAHVIVHLTIRTQAQGSN